MTTFQELVEEAKIKYPIGCYISNVNLGRGYTFSMQTFDFKKDGEDNIIVKQNRGSWYTIYSNGQWADILSYPKNDIVTNENLLYQML